jgi:hypothetical protein
MVQSKVNHMHSLLAQQHAKQVLFCRLIVIAVLIMIIRPVTEHAVTGGSSLRLQSMRMAALGGCSLWRAAMHPPAAEHSQQTSGNTQLGTGCDQHMHGSSIITRGCDSDCNLL